MVRTILLIVVAAMAFGCSSGGGSVDVGAVQKQKELQNKLNNEQKKNLPPGEGPAG